MNYIGHLLIADQANSSMVGNLLPDLVRKSEWIELPNDVINGCHLHQQVDQLTDRHARFIEIKRSLPSEWRHWGAILLDLSIDYTVANNFDQVSSESFDTFINRCYTQLSKELNDIPNQRIKNRLGFMIERDWLRSYRAIDSLKMALVHLDKKSRFDTPLLQGAKMIEAKGDEWKQPLLQVWSEVAAAIDGYD